MQYTSLLRRLNGADQTTLFLLVDFLMYPNSAASRMIAIDVAKRISPRRRRLAYYSLFVNDINGDVRNHVAYALSCEPSGSATKLLQVLQNDDVAMVRATAIESLGLSKSGRLPPEVIRRLDDKSPLVRSAAAVAVGLKKVYGCKTICTKRFRLEKDSSVKIALSFALWRLGEQAGFDSLLKFLKSKQYQSRCASANLLTHAKGKDSAVAIAQIKTALAVETVDTVKQCLENAIRIIRK